MITLQEPARPGDSDNTRAVKRLYSSCMNTDRIEARQEAPLLHLLAEMGGWPVLVGDTWNQVRTTTLAPTHF